ncbi:MAG: amidase [Rhodospirillaceae bacterium]|jgi:amidase|nr:amidase [Rhodospirillaceae bacterium]MBT6427189.1 amidase [Rhodospirillaceae bacterium]MBT7756567.1 amidase [Rhodospirillaceae bacterium]
MTELWQKSANEMVTLLKGGQIRPSEAVDAAAQRIEATNGAVNSMVTLCLVRAQDYAARIEAQGHPERPGPGYLYGLPISVKDLQHVEGVLCTEGSPIYADRVSPESDMLVQSLENNGAIVVGKSNTPEFGAGANTFNEVFGATLNPWDTRMTCGGSSGGAAVSLATGQTWLATGSDLGGSLRIPGAFCSVVGFRPSPGRCPRGTSTYLGRFNDLGVVGPMARNVADVALMLDAMVGQYAHDPISLPVPNEPFQQAAQTATPPRRIGWSATLGIAPVEPEVAEICAAAAASFGDLGTDVDEATPDFTGATEMFLAFRGAMFVAGHGRHIAEHRDQLKPEVIWNYEYGLARTPEDMARAQLTRARIHVSMCEFFETYDLLVTPTVMTPPFPVETRYLEEVAGVKFDNYIEWLMHTFVITPSGCPAVSIPCGFTKDGLPVGLQLVAPPRGEAALLSAAAAFEANQRLQWQTPIDPRVK